MRNPRRWRNLALCFFATGIIALPLAFLLPESAADDTMRRILGVYGAMALLFGGGAALTWHLAVRAKISLARGENILARWHVDPITWRTFMTLNEELHAVPGALSNELHMREQILSDGVEIIVGESAIQIDESIHTLPRRGTPEVTHATLHTARSGLRYAELRLYYPGGGQGASGIPHPPRRTLLRFPVAEDALGDAESAIARYNAGRPGDADLFHGRGDGTNPEDLSKCMTCGYATHKFVSHCPRCGGSMQSKRWSRRFGALLILCGLFITGMMGAVLNFTIPLLLQPGVTINGNTFSGTPVQALAVLCVLALTAAFGLTVLLYGFWQLLTGRRDFKAVLIIAGLAGILFTAALLMTG